jgi:tetratricopeptide (TPR) repeat protein
MVPVKTFVQRTSLRENIREQLCRQPDNDRRREPKKVGVWGLGGAGKSQLALSYLQRYSADYVATFWIQAGQIASIDRDFLEIYQLLPWNTPLQSRQTTPEDVRRAVLNWFTRKPGKWLIIFDGADDLHKRDRNFVDLSQYIPGCPGVHVIITSRSSIARKFSTFEGVNVGDLEEPQAVDLFLRCAEILRTKKTEAEVQAIVNELGCLALAITIAGTYVSQTPRLSSHLPAYLKDYCQRRQALLAEQPDELIDKYGYSVMTVWETSYAAVYNQLPEACWVLTLLAFVNYEDIFFDLFDFESHTNSTQLQPLWTSIISTQIPITVSSFEKYFAILERYSLLQWQRDKNSYSMHRLVHAWGHDRLQQKNRSDIKHFCLAAFQLLFNAVSNCKNLPQAKLRLVPHLRENFDAIRRLETDTESENIDLIDKLEYIGGITNEIARWEEAAAIRQEVLEKRQRVLGNEHPDTIKAMNNLATTLRNQGKLNDATAMQRKVLKKRQEILGDEHLDTIKAMNNLGNMLFDQGKLDDAAAKQREVLEKLQEILGDDHPDTIKVMNNLANTLSVQGELDEAAAKQREVLEKRQRILGNEHRDTITAMSNLALTLSDQGKLDEAAAKQREVLEKRRRNLGDEHPDTIIAMLNLAITLSNQGKLDEAAALQREVLEKRQRNLKKRSKL